LLVNVSLIYTRLSLLLAAVDRGSRAVNDSQRINHAAKTLKYSHIRRRAATSEVACSGRSFGSDNQSR
jgi:hypothetical protein